MSHGAHLIVTRLARGDRSLLDEHPVHELDADGPLADGGGDALHVAAARIADGEDAGKAGLEQMRRTRERPARGREIVRREIGSGPRVPPRASRTARVPPIAGIAQTLLNEVSARGPTRTSMSRSMSNNARASATW